MFFLVLIFHFLSIPNDSVLKNSRKIEPAGNVFVSFFYSVSLKFDISCQLLFVGKQLEAWK